MQVEISEAMTKWFAEQLGVVKGDAIAASNAQFAVVLNLLIKAGVITHSDAIDEIDGQIGHIAKPDVTVGLALVRDLLAKKEGPIFSVIEGGLTE